MELQVILNTYATDIFRRQADFDYIAARANFRMQLRQQLLWSAQQAVEKYLKAILLFNGMSARYKEHGSQGRREYGHDLVALLEAVRRIPIFNFELDSEDEKFVHYLSEQGPNRYISTTAYNTGAVLRRLDSCVWHIRRYCQYMPDRGLGCKTEVPGMREAYIRAALNPSHKINPHRFRLFSGDLEKILKRPSTDAARCTLVWANLFYGTKRRTFVNYTTFNSADIPPIERGWHDVDWQEVEKYVKP